VSFSSTSPAHAASANTAKVTKTVASQTKMGERRVDDAFIGQILLQKKYYDVAKTS
jgi:hypothetical protein